MDRQKGIAYCGLACCLCGLQSCPGCQSGGCTDKDWCKNYRCCREKGLSGCWECDAFPCEGSMLDKLRIRSFAKFVSLHGEQTLMDCLERNECAGVVYHHEGKLTGDYDALQTQEEIFKMLLQANQPSSQQ